MTVMPPFPARGSMDWHTDLKTYLDAMQHRGDLPDHTDLNDLKTASDIGTWQLRSTYTYGNMPMPLSGGAVLEVQGTLSSCLQRITIGGNVDESHMFWRESRGDASDRWSEWVSSQSGQADGTAEKIKTLAARDGWHAVFDPTDSSTVTISGSRVSEIRDGLGNVPALVNGENSGPVHVAGEFGQISGVASPNGAPWHLTSNAPRITDPTTMLVVARQSGRGEQFIFDGVSGRRALHAENTRGAAVMFAGGGNRGEGALSDSKPHVYRVTFDQVSSVVAVDGDIRWFGDAGNFNALTGLRVGADTDKGRSWKGAIGPVLIYRGVPPEGVVERMETLLRTLAGTPAPAPRFSAGTRVLSRNLAGDVDLSVGEPLGVSTHGIQSMTKMVTATVAWANLSQGDLSTTVTVQESDIWNGNRLSAGDRLSMLDLFYLMALPSDNTAPYVVARVVGQKLLDAESNPGGDPYERFYAEMHSMADAWGWGGSDLFTHAHSRAKLNLVQVAEAAQRVYEDPFLVTVFGARTRPVTITGGPNPRSYQVEHTLFGANNPFPVPEFLVAKTGSGNGYGHVVLVWDHPDGLKRVTVIADTPTSDPSRRFVELRKALYAVEQGK